MTPKDAFPDTLDEVEKREETRWNAFWATFPGWLKGSIIALLSALTAAVATYQAKPVTKAEVADINWDQKDLEKIVTGMKRVEGKMDRVAEQMEAVTNTLEKDKRLQVRDQMARYDKRKDDRERGN